MVYLSISGFCYRKLKTDNGISSFGVLGTRLGFQFVLRSKGLLDELYECYLVYFFFFG